jgi:hypothetical protein
VKRGLALWAVAAAALAARAQVPSEEIKVQPPLPAAQALAVVTQATAARIAGVGALGPAGQKPVAFDAPLPAALRAVSDATGLLFTRLGPYDWFVIAPPPIPPTATSQALAGPFRVRVANAGAGGAGDTAGLALDLTVEADSDRQLASLYDVDLGTVKLTPDGGPAMAVRTSEFRPPAARQRRLGYHARLPFPPAPGGVAATLSGQLLSFEEVRPLAFRLNPQPGDRMDQEDASLTFQSAERLGRVYDVSLGLERHAALGDEEPWLDVCLSDAAGQRWRPRDLSCLPQPVGAGPDLARHAVRLLFDLPAAAQPRQLDVVLMARRRPWIRTAFTLSGLVLPAAQTMVGGGSLAN